MKHCLKRKYRFALKAGFATFLSLLLTTALFAAPHIATLFDFGHSHDPGTPNHTHPVQVHLTSLNVEVVTVFRNSFAVIWLVLPAYVLAFLKRVFEAATASRAPPISSARSV